MEADAIEARKAAIFAEARRRQALQPLNSNSNESIAEQQEKASLARANALRNRLLARASVATPTNRPNGLAGTRRPASPMEEGQIAESNKVPRRRLEPRVIHNSEPPSLLRQCGNRVDGRGYQAIVASSSSSKLLLPPPQERPRADRWEHAEKMVADLLLLEEKSKSSKSKSSQRSGGGPISKRLPSAAKRRGDELVRRAAYQRPPCALLDIFRDDHLASVLIESTSEGLLFDDESTFNEYQRVVKKFLIAFKLYREGNIDAETFAVHRMTFMTDLAAAIGKAKDGKYAGRINYGEMDTSGDDCWAIWGLHFATLKELLHLSDTDKERHCVMTLICACVRLIKQSAARFMDNEARRRLDPTAEKSNVVCNSAAAFDASLLVYDVDDTDAVDNFCNDLDITEGQFYLPSFLLASSLAELSYEAHDGRLVPFMTCSIVTHTKLYGCSPPTTTARLRSFGNGTHPQNLLTCVTQAYPDEEKERNNRVYEFIFETQELAPVRAMYEDADLELTTNFLFDWGTAMSDEMIEELQECLRLGQIAGGLTVSTAWAAEVAAEELTDRQMRIVSQLYLQAHKHGLANDIPDLQLALSAMMREHAEDQIASYGEKNGGMSRDAAAGALMAHVRSSKRDEESKETRAKKSEALKGIKRSDEHCANISAGLTGKTRAKRSDIGSKRSEEESEETRAKRSEANKGKVVSEEARANMSKGHEEGDRKKWDAKFDELRFFKNEHDHCNVSRAAEQAKLSGWSLELARWVSEQRCRRRGTSACKKLTEEQVALLDELGFVWEIGRGNG